MEKEVLFILSRFFLTRLLQRKNGHRDGRSATKGGASFCRTTLIFGVTPLLSTTSATTPPRHHATTTTATTTATPRPRKWVPFSTNFRACLASVRVRVPPPLQLFRHGFVGSKRLVPQYFSLLFWRLVLVFALFFFAPLFGRKKEHQ